jgi:excisionase family DNA binding protein
MLLLTFQDVAKELRISVSQVHRLRASGRLTAVKIGKVVRFTPEAVQAVIRGLTEEPPHVQRPASPSPSHGLSVRELNQRYPRRRASSPMIGKHRQTM